MTGEGRPWRAMGRLDTFVGEVQMSLGKTLRRMISHLHVWLYRRTNGRLFSMGHRLVIVTTTGAKSHQPRTNPLVAFPHAEGWVVVAAAGRHRHPGWYHNMVATPDVTVERDGGSCRMVAREAGGSERETIWSEVVENEPSYADFQKRTDRLIPVMVLEPALVEPSTPATPRSRRGQSSPAAV